MQLRAFVVSLIACMAVSARAEPQAVCAEVDAGGGATSPVVQALGDRGIAAPRPGCATTRVRVGADGVWAVRLPHGVEASRAFAAVEVGAAWVDSLVRPSRLADLLQPPAPRPTTATPPPGPEAMPGVSLYASFEAWRADQAVATFDGSLAPRTVSPGLVGEGGLEPMWVLDRPKRDARPDGRVFAFVAGGEVYLHDGTPYAHKGAPFGRLTAVGDRGVFQREVCFWVQTVPPSSDRAGAGFVKCEVALRLIDLETGEITPLDGKRVRELVQVDPALAAAWEAARPKHAGVQRTFALRALQASAP